jgi:hypothetical protein
MSSTPQVPRRWYLITHSASSGALREHGLCVMGVVFSKFKKIEFSYVLMAH